MMKPHPWRRFRAVVVANLLGTIGGFVALLVLTHRGFRVSAWVGVSWVVAVWITRILVANFACPRTGRSMAGKFVLPFGRPRCGSCGAQEGDPEGNAGESPERGGTPGRGL
jgi:hypothetical protein